MIKQYDNDNEAQITNGKNPREVGLKNNLTV